MRREIAFALLASLPASFAAAQQAASPARSASAAAPPAAQTVYYAGPGVTAPELLSDFSPIRKPHHCEELDRTVKLAAVIDASGTPQEVRILEADEAAISDFAANLVESEKFRPGSYNGAPSAMAIDITLEFKTCVQFRKVSGEKTDKIVLRDPPTQSTVLRSPPDATAPVRPYTVGGRVSAPIPIFSPDPHYSAYGRKEKIQGICVIGLNVDAQGNPQNVHLVKSLEASLDQNALEAVEGWKFKPALKDGTEPVPVAITVEISFRLR